MTLKVSHRTAGSVLLMLSPFPFLGLLLLMDCLGFFMFASFSDMAAGWRSALMRYWALAAGTVSVQFLLLAVAPRGAPDEGALRSLRSARRWSLIAVVTQSLSIGMVAAILAAERSGGRGRYPTFHPVIQCVLLLGYLPLAISQLELSRACRAAARACESPFGESLAGHAVHLWWVLLGLLFLALDLRLAAQLLDSESLRSLGALLTLIEVLLAGAWILICAACLLATGTAVIRHGGPVRPPKRQPEKTP